MQMPAAKSNEKCRCKHNSPPEKREEVGGTKFSACTAGERRQLRACLLQCTRDVMNAASMQIPYQTYVSKHTKRSDKVFAAASGLKLYICTKCKYIKHYHNVKKSNGIDAVTHSVNLLFVLWREMQIRSCQQQERT